MPIYVYKCKVCGERATKLSTVKNRKLCHCSRCGTMMDRDIQSEHVKTTNMDYDKPVFSDAAGCHPSQVAQFRKEHPNLTVTDEGQVVFTSHAQRKAALRELHLHDRDGYD